MTDMDRLLQRVIARELAAISDARWAESEDFREWSDELLESDYARIVELFASEV